MQSSDQKSDRRASTPVSLSQLSQRQIPFHYVVDPEQVDRAILWNANRKRVEFLPLHIAELPNQWNRRVAICKSEVPILDVDSCQLLLLGGTRTTHYKLGNLTNRCSGDSAAVRKLFLSQPQKRVGDRLVREVQDLVVINTPLQICNVIIAPHPYITKMGWDEPIMLDVVEKPKLEQPSQLFARGFDPSPECRHFIGPITWQLTDAEIADWDRFSELMIEVACYTSYLCQDMKLDSGKGNEG